ncbi:hypothetical protein RFI_37144 [Reticulomyxa filosa]|uniref:Uncharacterized protein n=1 Tax=Reticulomyxa filosa TaxID=46433 RepID=X6LGR0_RETFI|nr:hypothetical protein RFI_37144 [Reticulomyxa filosa]|eukprot:ETO00302.1 hypothetical protein RFI_37144 [Reticulomyxa filosa]
MEVGRNLLDISKVNEAIQLFHFALCFNLQTLRDSDVDVAASYYWLGRSYEDKGEYDKAIEYYEKDLKISLNTQRSNHIDALYHSLGVVHQNEGEYDKAIKYHFSTSPLCRLKQQFGFVNTTNHTYIAYIYLFISSQLDVSSLIFSISNI